MVAPIAVKHDAVSAAVLDTVRALNADAGFSTRYLGTVCQFPEINHIVCSNAGELLALAEYREADAAIFHFGIYHDLFDAILANGPPKRIVVFHNVTPPSLVSSNLLPMIYRSLAQIENFRNADEIWADSEINRQFLIERGFEPANIHVVPLVVGSPPRARLETKPTSPIEVLFLGRVVASKGVHDLIAAVAKAPRAHGNFHLTIAGNTAWSDPHYVIGIQKLIDKFDLSERVTFLGTVDDHQRDALLHSSHILVVPSYHEGFCKPVIEGFRAGCIPLVYNAYNLPNIVNRLGLVCPIGNVDKLSLLLTELADVVLSGLQNPDTPLLRLERGLTSVRQFGLLAASYAETFSLDVVGRQQRQRVRDLVSQ